MYPLFKWAGGKTRMIKNYLDVIPHDKTTYVEPFVGGGAMFAHVKTTMPSYRSFVINDINTEVINLYTQVRDNLSGVVDGMVHFSDQYLPLSKDDRKTFYYDLREQYTQEYHEWSSCREAYTLYFLLRTSFNGIWQTTKASKGRFATPCGLLKHTTTVFDLDNTKVWSSALQGVVINSTNWSDLQAYDSTDSWFFMDPPYRGGHTTYETVFNDTDQIEILDFMGGAKSFVTLCNRDIGDGFYGTHLPFGYKMRNFDVIYTAGRRKRLDDGGHAAKSAVEVFIYPDGGQ